MKGLFLTDRPLRMKKYILLMALTSLIPSLLLSVVVTSCGVNDVGPEFDPRIPAGLTVLGIAVISPIIETLLMSLIFLILSFFIRSGLTLAIISAILWGLLHSLLAPAWGLIVWWPFFVFSCAYLTWRKQSWLKAVWVTTCIHFLQNLIPSIVILIAMQQ